MSDLICQARPARRAPGAAGVAAGLALLFAGVPAVAEEALQEVIAKWIKAAGK
jgi:hypothetical protein